MNKDFKKMVAYVHFKMAHALRVKLAVKGLTFSEWVRRKAQEEIDKQD